MEADDSDESAHAFGVSRWQIDREVELASIQGERDELSGKLVELEGKLHAVFSQTECLEREKSVLVERLEIFTASRKGEALPARAGTSLPQNHFVIEQGDEGRVTVIHTKLQQVEGVVLDQMTALHDQEMELARLADLNKELRRRRDTAGTAASRPMGVADADRSRLLGDVGRAREKVRLLEGELERMNPPRTVVEAIAEPQTLEVAAAIDPGWLVLADFDELCAPILEQLAGLAGVDLMRTAQVKFSAALGERLRQDKEALACAIAQVQETTQAQDKAQREIKHLSGLLAEAGQDVEPLHDRLSAWDDAVQQGDELSQLFKRRCRKWRRMKAALWKDLQARLSDAEDTLRQAHSDELLALKGRLAAAQEVEGKVRSDAEWVIRSAQASVKTADERAQAAKHAALSARAELAKADAQTQELSRRCEIMQQKLAEAERNVCQGETLHEKLKKQHYAAEATLRQMCELDQQRAAKLRAEAANAQAQFDQAQSELRTARAARDELELRARTHQVEFEAFIRKETSEAEMLQSRRIEALKSIQLRVREEGEGRIRAMQKAAQDDLRDVCGAITRLFHSFVDTRRGLDKASIIATLARIRDEMRHLRHQSIQA